MQALDILEKHADLILELHKQSTGLVDLTAKLIESGNELATISDASYKKLLPGFIRGLEIGSKRIAELEAQLENQIHDHAMDINTMNECTNLDTLLNATVASVKANNDTPDTYTAGDTSDTSIVSNDTTGDLNGDIYSVSLDTPTDINCDTSDTHIDTLVKKVVADLMPMIRVSVCNALNNNHVSLDTHVDTSDVSSDTSYDIPKRIKGYRVNKRGDGRYVLLNGKTTIYIGKQWDMDKALRLIEQKQAAQNGQQALLQV